MCIMGVITKCYPQPHVSCYEIDSKVRRQCDSGVDDDNDCNQCMAVMMWTMKYDDCDDVPDSIDGDDADDIYNKSEIDVKQVNFTGRIIHREMRLSDTCGQLLPGNNVFVPHFGALEESTVHLMELGYGYLGNNTLFICVQDLHSPNTLDVYVDLSTAPYKDGLLPGAVISCRRFLRKVSRNGNVYCSFDACSSLTVQVAASKDPRDTSSNTVSKVDSNNQQMSAVPCRLLADLVRCEASGNQDGTAEALVYLSNESISFLLKLSNDELSKLKSYALSLGELVYQRHSYGRDILNKGDNAHLLSKQSEANRILADRCCAQQVKRSVILYCKPMGSVNKKADITEQVDIAVNLDDTIYTKVSKCPEGTFNRNLYCVAKCGPGFYGNVLARACLPCSKACRTCFDGVGSNKCSSCYDPYYLYMYTCAKGCEEMYKQGPPSRKIRLVSDGSHFQGRVEVLRQKTWGTICDDGWDINDAQVVCRELMLGDALAAVTRGRMGAGSDDQPIWLSKLGCTGNESRIDSCAHAPWGTHSCGHFEDAGVVCSGPDSTRRCVKQCGPGYYKVANTANCGVCAPECLTCANASTSCSSCDGTSFLIGNRCLGECSEGYFGNPDRRVCQKCDASCRTCSGRANSCTGCEDDRFLSNTTCVKKCSVVQVAQQRLIRLSGSKRLSSYEGRVEVFRNGEWSTVCDEYWDFKEATVVCRQLGMGRAIRAMSSGKFGAGTGRIWFDKLLCTGLESSLFECPYEKVVWNSRCYHVKDAGVVCSGPQSGNPLTNMCVKQCREGFYKDSNDICKPCNAGRCAACIGYSFRCTKCKSPKFLKDNNCMNSCGGSSYGHVPSRTCKTCDKKCVTCANGIDGTNCTSCSAPFTLKDGKCTGSCSPDLYRYMGKCIKECPVGHYSLAYNFTCMKCPKECFSCVYDQSNKAAKCILCKPPLVSNNGACTPNCSSAGKVSFPVANATGSVKVRLVNGSDHLEGLLQIYHDGVWGTICDDGWDYLEAKVLCKQLNLGVQSSRPLTTIPKGFGRIWLDDMFCTGRENSLEECVHRPWGQTNCNHNEDVVILYNGIWGTICDDGWDIRDATVVCRMLNLGNATEAVTTARFGPGKGKTWLDDVDCLGNENSLGKCSHQGWGQENCEHSEDAGVRCSGPDHSRDCIKNCIDGFFHNSTARSCGKCSPDCKTCQDYPDNCLSCEPNEFLNISTVRNTCVQDCGDGFYADNSTWKCKPCSLNCTSCFAIPTNCTSCDPSKVLDTETNICVSSCRDKSLISGVDNIRLAGTNETKFGRVEVKYKGVWGTVCDDSFDDKDADVACRQLKLGRGGYVKMNAFYGPGTGKVWLDDLQCRGTERSLFDCRMNSGKGIIWMDNVDCYGYESSITQCRSHGWGINNCDSNHGEDASVVCDNTTIEDVANNYCREVVPLSCKDDDPCFSGVTCVDLGLLTKTGKKESICLQCPDKYIGDGRVCREIPEIKVSASVLVSAGSTAYLTCIVSSFPPANITWKRNGAVLDGDRFVSLSYNYTLVIPSVTFKDSGEYECVAENELGKAISKVTLSVGRPPEFFIEPSQQTATKGEAKTLKCGVRGQPQPTITWKKDGQVVVPDENHVISPNMLTLRRINESDIGYYACIARNPQKIITSFASIIMIGIIKVAAKLKGKKGGLSSGAIIAIVVILLVILLVIIGVVLYRYWSGGSSHRADTSCVRYELGDDSGKPDRLTALKYKLRPSSRSVREPMDMYEDSKPFADHDTL
ncbi:hypothetical protein QZH41_015006 [Actinostola sp. cb2023]|nr:hypothetical protein QZH41_015006 [Actinostola sp. cb2023]